MSAFNWKSPDYVPVYQERMDRLSEIRRNPKLLGPLKTFYRDHPADFINDWGNTFDPRLADRKMPTVVPFLLFPRQREWIDWFMERMANQEDGITEKSRDMGISWLCVSTFATLALFTQGFVGGFGSRKEALVDKAGDPDALFWKARMFLRMLPLEFRGMWREDKHSSHLQITFPESGSILRGEAGDNIGRGGRATAYVTDEDAFIPRGAVVDAALSQTTNCRQRVSSINGMNNPFAIKRHEGKTPVFTFRWTDDPRKDAAWYEKMKGKYDPLIIAQEIDINYSASATGVVIPAEWVNAAIGAHAILGIAITGESTGALDVADEGIDKNAYAGRKGILLNFLDQWSGSGSDIYETVVKAHGYARDLGHVGYRFDSDGLGAGVRGDARVINERQAEHGLRLLDVEPFRGSGAVLDKEDPIETIEDEPGRDSLQRTNEDYFKNAKSQAWFSIRLRFQRTYREVSRVLAARALGEDPGPLTYDPDLLISIDPDLPNLSVLRGELSQPLYKKDDTGKILIQKTPDGMKSPNLADAVMILFAPRTSATSIFDMIKRPTR